MTTCSQPLKHISMDQRNTQKALDNIYNSFPMPTSTKSRDNIIKTVIDLNTVLMSKCFPSSKVYTINCSYVMTFQRNYIKLIRVME